MSPQDYFYRDVSKIEDILEHAQTVELEVTIGPSRASAVPHAVSSLSIADTQKATYVVREVNQIYEVHTLTVHDCVCVCVCVVSLQIH
jgi:hypothetical protein